MPSILEAKSVPETSAKDKWLKVAFWVAVVLLVGAVFCYGMFWLKAHLLNQALAEVDSQALRYGTQAEKDAEKNVLTTQKQINDFAVVLNSQKITSNVFTFIEQKTLPNVWFSNFNLSQSSSELRLSGEAEDMATLSQQFKVFEDSNDHIKNISVFNSQISSTGRVSFLMNITVLPKIFEYMAPAQPAAPPTNENQ
ncbi:MAG TPA: hypothetical protein VI937_02595 [Negativicutes bacterium]|nr:hypothetical protein [Negativicutes bacterium]